MPQPRADTVLRGVFFDLDGTLIVDRDVIGSRRDPASTPPASIAAGAQLATAWADAFGHPIAPDELEAAIHAAYEERFLYGRPGYADLGHLGMREFLEQLLDGTRAHLGVSIGGESDRFLLAWGEIERQALAVAPGAREVLAALRGAGLPVGLITNGPSCLQREKLALLDLASSLDPIIVDTEVGYSKPDRRIFDHAASRVGLEPEQLLFVGDTPSADIAGAVGAGWTAVWICRADRAFAADVPPPHHTIAALPDLLTLPSVREAIEAGISAG